MDMNKSADDKNATKHIYAQSLGNGCGFHMEL